MTQDPTTQPPGRPAPSASGAPDASAYTAEDLAKVVAMAVKGRRRFELDPRGYVEPQVRTKLRQLSYQGLLRNDAQEHQARLFFARYYQEKGGIENPRLLSNQERALLVQDFLRAGLAARVDMMEGLESAFSEDWPRAFGELVEALPLRERAVARRTFERFEHHRLHSVDPKVGLRIDDWSGMLDQAPAPAAPGVGNFGAGRPAPGPDGQGEAAPPRDLPARGASAPEPPGPPPAPDVTDDWSGPALDAGRAAALAGLIEDVLVAAPADLTALEPRIRAAFADDPFTVQRVLRLARARLGQGDDFLQLTRESRAQEAGVALRDLRDRLAEGWDYKGRRREDRAAFAALEAETGFRLRLTADGRIAIGEPGERPLAVVGWPLARALSREPGKLRDRFALIDRLVTSPESDAVLRDRIDQALGLDMGPTLLLDVGAGPYEAPGSAERRAAVLAGRAALREGHDPAAVRSGLIAVLFPELTEDPFAWGELLLDLLPVIGEIRSAADAVESFDAMAGALASGDLEEAAKQGLLGALATAGAVPALGPLFKTLRTLTVRALRTRAGTALTRGNDLVKGPASRLILARSRRPPDFVAGIKPEVVFGDLWANLAADQRKLLHGLMPHLKGKPLEKDLERLLDNAGIQVLAVQHPLPISQRSVADAVSRNGFSDGFRLLTNSFVFPTKGEKGTIFEFKLGDTPLSKGQKAGQDAVEAGQKAGGTPPRLAGVSAVDFQVLRLGFDQVPEDVIESEARRLLGNHVNGVRSRRLSQADVDALVGQFLAWHRDLRKRTAGEVATLGEAFLALGLAAGARAARHGLEPEDEAPEAQD